MPRKLIHAFNILALGLLLIVLPGIANFRLMSWTVSSPEIHHWFTMIGFGAALFFNLILLATVKMRKSRRVLCAKWAVAQAALGLLFMLMWRKVIHFEWMRAWLE